jgi:hypothetical protein
LDTDAKLLISCVGEDDALYTAEVLLLFKTIKKFGGKVADGILVANFVKSIDPTIKQSLEDLGVEVKIVEAVEYSRETTSDKIRMLEMDDYDYDVLIALDCDTAVVRDFSSEINPHFFQAMPLVSDWQTNMGILTVQQWQKLLSCIKWDLLPGSFNTEKRNIFPYFNAGVLSIPKHYVKQLRKTWGEYILRLFEYSQELWTATNAGEGKKYTYSFEEIALSLAREKEKIPFKLLPLAMNFDIGWVPIGYAPILFKRHSEVIREKYFKCYLMAKYGPGIQSIPESEMPDNILPFILHYHHKYDTNGLIMKTGYKMPDLALQQVNELLDETNPITKQFDSKRIHLYKIHLQKVILSKEKLIGQKERVIKVLYSDIIRVKADLKRAIKDVEILQNINLGHQKAIEEKDAELKRAIKDVEILQNINLGHQGRIAEKDKLIEHLDNQLKNAIKDEDNLQNINLGHQKAIEEKDAQLKRTIKDVDILQSIIIGHQKMIEEKDNKLKSMHMELQKLRQ